jgi:hypothetical protein
MATVLEVSPSTVMRHWQANGLKPHLVLRLRVSQDLCLAAEHPGAILAPHHS